MMKRKNKKGWIKIIEAVIALLLITGILLIIAGKGTISKQDISLKVYEAESLILREIELNDLFRKNISNATGQGELINPIEWDDFSTGELKYVRLKIEEKIPNYLNCVAWVCNLNDTCIYVHPQNKDIYAQSTAIASANATGYPNFRQLKLFCWVK